jgi:Uma2 family endonuclease
MATLTRTRAVTYPSSDGKPMAETDYHVALIVQSLSLLQDYYSDRDDVYIAGNNFVYYEEGNPKQRLSPDTYLVFGVQRGLRDSYKVWEEGQFPDLVIEYTSKKTRKEDMTKKFAIYRDVWRVKEYFLFDPRADYLKASPTGYRLMGDEFVPIERVQGRLESQVLGFTLERDRNELLFRDARTGERIRDRDQQKLQIAESERREAERLRAVEAAKRREAEAEIERLQAIVASLQADGRRTD